jgi:fimbrial chaperone protein
MSPGPLATVAVGLLLAGGGSSLRAGSYQVQPVRIELSANSPSLTVQVRNLGEEATTIQTQVSSWRADGTEEILSATDELLLNPPIFTLEPGKVQLMRVGLRRPLISPVEGTYRLILEEVPPAPKPGFMGVTTLLKLSVPVFVAPAVPAPQLVWGMRRISDTETQLWVENRGNAHVQIRSLDVSRAGVNELEYRQERMAYVLPQGRKEWVIPGGVFAQAGMSVLARTDIGEIRVRIPPDSR